MFHFLMAILFSFRILILCPLSIHFPRIIFDTSYPIFSKLSFCTKWNHHFGQEWMCVASFNVTLNGDKANYSFISIIQTSGEWKM